MTIDLIALLLLGLLLVRGWARGFVREAMDLTGLLVGVLLAFRLSGVAGGLVRLVLRTSEPSSRVIGGMLVLIGIGVAAALITRVVEQRFRLPGLNLVNRAGGAGLAAVWGAFLATLLLTLAVVLPMPPAVAEHLGSSAVARTLTDPDGLPQGVFTDLAGDRMVGALLTLRDLVGARQVVIGPDDRIEIPPADAGALDPAPEQARVVAGLLDGARIEAGLESLVWDDRLAAVAVAHATEMYLDGYFAHESPRTGHVGDRLATAGVRYSVAGENLALAISPREIHDGLMDSPGHRANMLSPAYRRVGVGVVAGPLGLMTVQVFTG